ncbi:hypothetical protein HK102_001544 [Quaeritorhiza haematococci]|nr:hypothetical protein HK102_001544 [Quaeritorhiza haematococci]
MGDPLKDPPLAAPTPTESPSADFISDYISDLTVENIFVNENYDLIRYEKSRLRDLREMEKSAASILSLERENGQILVSLQKGREVTAELEKEVEARRKRALQMSNILAELLTINRKLKEGSRSALGSVSVLSSIHTKHSSSSYSYTPSQLGSSNVLSTIHSVFM